MLHSQYPENSIPLLMSYKELVAKHEKAVAAGKQQPSDDNVSKPSSLFVVTAAGTDLSKSSQSQYILDQQGFSVLQVSCSNLIHYIDLQ